MYENKSYSASIDSNNSNNNNKCKLDCNNNSFFIIYIIFEKKNISYCIFACVCVCMCVSVRVSVGVTASMENYMGGGWIGAALPLYMRVLHVIKFACE